MLATSLALGAPAIPRNTTRSGRSARYADGPWINLQTVLAPAVFGTRLDVREQLGTLVCVLGSAGFAALRIRSAPPPKERRE